jgi:hypothetical protein
MSSRTKNTPLVTSHTHTTTAVQNRSMPLCAMLHRLEPTHHVPETSIPYAYMATMYTTPSVPMVVLRKCTSLMVAPFELHVGAGEVNIEYTEIPEQDVHGHPETNMQTMTPPPPQTHNTPQAPHFPRFLYRGTSLIRNRHPVGPYSMPMSRALCWS